VPKLLQEKYGIDLHPTQFGFSKLTDLLLSMDSTFAIEFKSQNYPVVMLAKHKNVPFGNFPT